MAKRMLFMLAAVAVFLVAIGSVKYCQIRAAIAGASYRPPPEAVTTIVAREEAWPETLTTVGTIAAVRGVTVSADLPGIVEKITFESGTSVRAGELLVQQDTSQERAQLAAVESQRKLVDLNAERMRELRAKGVTSQAELDAATSEAQQAAARVGEIRAMIARKTIRAPFAGRLGIRQVNTGQYLAPGDPVVPLQSLQPVYVDFAVPQQQVRALVLGTEVQATEHTTGVATAGKVTAVDSVVDSATRNARVQATFENRDGHLLPGMFVDVEAVLGAGRPVIVLPATAISYAPYGDSVFIVEELRGEDGQPYRGVRQQFVKLGGRRGDQVAVIDGVRDGEEVATSGIFKLRNGAAVQVDNTIQPPNDARPQPEDT